MLQSGSPLVAARGQPGGRPPAGDGDFHQPGTLIGGESGGGSSSPGEVGLLELGEPHCVAQNCLGCFSPDPVSFGWIIVIRLIKRWDLSEKQRKINKRLKDRTGLMLLGVGVKRK